jgi:hypothetical protein
MQRWSIAYRVYPQSPWIMYRLTYRNKDDAKEQAYKILETGAFCVVVHWLDLSEYSKQGDVL